MDIYRRIYRLAAKNVPANQIAVTLGLPLSHIKDILKRLTAEPAKYNQPEVSTQAEADATTEEDDDTKYLDVYIMQESRVTVVDITGYAIEKNRFKFKIELNRVEKMDVKIVALQMNSLYEMDLSCYELIKNLHREYASRTRFVAILDPSRAMEKFIETNNVEKEVPVFGTISALERSASTMNSGR